MSEAIIKPTCEELFDEELELVQRSVDDSWRHGVYVTEVYKRESDLTYWKATYSQSTSGETNGLREGCAVITRVFPREVIAVEYTEEESVGDYV